MALHGQRTEHLLDAVAGWIERHPLGPLEPECFLVQNNGMAEWIKMSFARRRGICAALQVRMPARFQWQVYRRILGADAVPEHSPLDKAPLAWRIIQLFATRIDHDEPRQTDAFAPLFDYLAMDDAPWPRRYALAQRIADLYDQYQVYRPDWLEAWGEGRLVLIRGNGQEDAMPAEQRWQALLWQRICASLPSGGRVFDRIALQRQTIDRLTTLPARSDPGTAAALGLPRRVVIFGITQLPPQMLELLSGLAHHCQVILAVTNPCQFYWADIIDGWEALTARRRRQPLRGNLDLSQCKRSNIHEHAHPLLAGWGRQSRDFVRQLDVYDDLEAARLRFPMQRFDLFEDDDEPAPIESLPLLRQVQRHIRDLTPMREHGAPAIATDDRSIVFHVAHTPVRELEILHDQLLMRLAQQESGRTLQPRDIVVLVPAIETYAPAIRAIFGQYPASDARHIPFDIADLPTRGSSPLLAALEWLLNAPRDRCRLSDLAALLDVPAVTSRLGIDRTDLPRLIHWMDGAGIRWGLNAQHRADLELERCGATNTARFGLERMLMGYAVGRSDTEAYAGIEPYDEVGGLESGLAGALAVLIQRIEDWMSDSREPAPPAEWIERFTRLLGDFFDADEETGARALAALDDALSHLSGQFERAQFDQPIPLPIAAQAWLDTLDRPALSRRFRAGGVTFCTLLPMRAIPFEIVCLLGMNEPDYPRRSPRDDFDLMTVPLQRRPGDRARRDDDRQLMLEALLSARQALYISWCGRSVRDNSPQAPSVLVTQLREYLTRGWSASVVTDRTTDHPLHAFSRRYFEAGSEYFSYAHEWRTRHETAGLAPSDQATPATQAPLAGQDPPIPPLQPHGATTPLSLDRLVRFLRNPVRAYFRDRLNVYFDNVRWALPDDERFTFDALEHYGFVDQLSAGVKEAIESRFQSDPAASSLTEAALEALKARLGRQARAGELPLAGPGRLASDQLHALIQPMIEAWAEQRQRYPAALERRTLRFEHAGCILEGSLERRGTGLDCAEAGVCLTLDAGLRTQTVKKQVRPQVDRMIGTWVRCLLSASSGIVATHIVVGRTNVFTIDPLPIEEAQRTLNTLIEHWLIGQTEALPIAPRTAIALLDHDLNKARSTYDGGEYQRGEGKEACLARCYTDFAALNQGRRFETLARPIYGPLKDWVDRQIRVGPAYGTPDPDRPEEAD
jgi:exodeoxyribonuclease V gamma subunit